LLKSNSHNIPWGIVTNADRTQRDRLQTLRLPSSPAAFLISEEVGLSKPDPRIFDLALEELGVADRRRSVMIGDDPSVDIEGARAAGLCTVLIAGGPPDRGAAALADALIDEFGELDTYWFA